MLSSFPCSFIFFSLTVSLLASFFHCTVLWHLTYYFVVACVLCFASFCRRSLVFFTGQSLFLYYCLSQYFLCHFSNYCSKFFSFLVHIIFKIFFLSCFSFKPFFNPITKFLLQSLIWCQFFCIVFYSAL